MVTQCTSRGELRKRCVVIVNTELRSCVNESEYFKNRLKEHLKNAIFTAQIK